VAHLVYTSTAAADRKTGVPDFDSKAIVGRHVRSCGVPYTIIAPAAFMINVLSPSSFRDGNLIMALPANRSLQMVALENIGEMAAPAGTLASSRCRLRLCAR
jgi:uncharacterized protein YbjT (DUF2867 family)